MTTVFTTKPTGVTQGSQHLWMDDSPTPTDTYRRHTSTCLKGRRHTKKPTEGKTAHKEANISGWIIVPTPNCLNNTPPPERPTLQTNRYAHQVPLQPTFLKGNIQCVSTTLPAELPTLQPNR